MNVSVVSKTDRLCNYPLANLVKFRVMKRASLVFAYKRTPRVLLEFVPFACSPGLKYSGTCLLVTRIPIFFLHFWPRRKFSLEEQKKCNSTYFPTSQAQLGILFLWNAIATTAFLFTAWSKKCCALTLHCMGFLFPIRYSQLGIRFHCIFTRSVVFIC